MGARVLEIQRRRAVLVRELADLEAELVEALEDEEPSDRPNRPREIAKPSRQPTELERAQARRALRRAGIA